MTTTVLAHAGGTGWDELLAYAAVASWTAGCVYVIRRMLKAEKQWEIEDDIASQLRGVDGDIDVPEPDQRSGARRVD
jgi:hypothetical protein